MIERAWKCAGRSRSRSRGCALVQGGEGGAWHGSSSRRAHQRRHGGRRGGGSRGGRGGGFHEGCGNRPRELGAAIRVVHVAATGGEASGAAPGLWPARGLFATNDSAAGGEGGLRRPPRRWTPTHWLLGVPPTLPARGRAEGASDGGGRGATQRRHRQSISRCSAWVVGRGAPRGTPAAHTRHTCRRWRDRHSTNILPPTDMTRTHDRAPVCLETKFCGRNLDAEQWTHGRVCTPDPECRRGVSTQRGARRGGPSRATVRGPVSARVGTHNAPPRSPRVNSNIRILAPAVLARLGAQAAPRMTRNGGPVRWAGSPAQRC